MLSRLASTAVTVRLHKQIFFEREATSMATFLWKVRFVLLFHWPRGACGNLVFYSCLGTVAR